MNDQHNPEPDIKKWIAPSFILSGICWYLSCGLNGDSWFLMWLAPIPVLAVALNLSGRKAFSISFLAYLIGRMSWFSYLITVATIIPAIIFTLLLPLIFGLIVTGTRWIVLKTKFRTGIFAFPVFFTALRISADQFLGRWNSRQYRILPGKFFTCHSDCLDYGHFRVSLLL